LASDAAQCSTTSASVGRPRPPGSRTPRRARRESVHLDDLRSGDAVEQLDEVLDLAG